MNKQAGYIASAHLLLISIAAGYFFFSKIPFTSPGQDHEISTNYISTEKTIILSEQAIKGKTLFVSKCASCHSLFKIMEGPPLAGVLEREPWTDRKQLYKWIRNPEGFIRKSGYFQDLKNKYKIIMPPFPSLTDEEIDSILAYIKEAGNPVAVP